MRVKVGDTWFEATPAQAIMVELDDEEKAHIANMGRISSHYAIFDGADPRSMHERAAWMSAGADCGCPQGAVCKTPECARLQR